MSAADAFTEYCRLADQGGCVPTGATLTVLSWSIDIGRSERSLESSQTGLGH
jgi:hypothetical protein